jgi:hypothetical protein
LIFTKWLESKQISIWLDDERDPNEPFIQREYGAKPGMLWAKTAKEAKDIISQGNVAFISFDHDLADIETGYDLAKWIEEQAYHKKIPRLIWTVHSDNMVGRRNIIMAMKNAEKFWG